MGAEKPREIAVRLLRRHAEGRDFIEELLEADRGMDELHGPDRGLVREIVSGIIRWQATLDWLIAAKTQGRTQKPALQILLRLGLYQMFWLDRIPDHAAVNESVQLAKELGFAPQSGFINAVLRGYLRERLQTAQSLEDLKSTEPAVGFSHPSWLIERWRARHGETALRTLLDWNNQPPVNYARVNTLRTTPSALTSRWTAEGVRFAPKTFRWVDPGLVFELTEHPPLARLPSFRDGWFYVQDPSTLLAGKELEPQPDDNVFDYCAAPGGKTTQMAQCMGNRGKIVAQDVDSIRTKLVAENCRRLGVTSVEIRDASIAPADAANLSVAPTPEFYDRVLIDVPCSNTGVMRRRVDLRWRLRPSEMERLPTLQLKLLERAASLVKSGGKLAYSTCSLEPEENGCVVSQFLAAQPDFQLVRDRQLLPFQDGVDGAYVALLRRID